MYIADLEKIALHFKLSPAYKDVIKNSSYNLMIYFVALIQPLPHSEIKTEICFPVKHKKKVVQNEKPTPKGYWFHRDYL